MMRIYRIAVLSTLALAPLASCGERARSADDPRAVPPADPATEAAGSALRQGQLPPPAVDSAAEAQSTGRQVQSGSAGQADATYPIVWDRFEPPPGPPPVTVPSNEAPVAPTRAEPGLRPAGPAPARARPWHPPDSAVADSAAKDSSRV